MEVRILLIVFITSYFIHAENQSNAKSPWHASIQYIGISYHPGGGDNKDKYPLKIDDDAYWLINVGASLSIDYDIIDSIAFIRSSVAFYKDCGFLYAGYVHLGMRGVIINIGRHSINGGIGATLLFRENWKNILGIENDSFYENGILNNRWEYQFIFYGGEFDYIYQFSQKFAFHYSIIPGFPFVITSKVGIRYDF